MTEPSGEETLRAKQEFEAHAASLGIRINHYHADNGRFKEAIFMDILRNGIQDHLYRFSLVFHLFMLASSLWS